MDRYNEVESSNEVKLSRVKKNNSLYEEIKNTDLSKIKTNSNIKVIENSGKTINLSKIKKYLENEPNQMKAKRNLIKVEETKEEEKVKEDKPKVYDINSVLADAKKNREIDYESERYKKLRDTQFDILSKIKMYEKNAVINEDESDEDLNTDERTLVNLINTVTIHKGEESLLGELIGGDDEDTTLPIEKEKEKPIITEEIGKPLKEEKAPIIKKVEEDVKEEEKVDKTLEKTIKEDIKLKEEELNKTKELTELKEKAKEIDSSFYTSSMSFSKDDFEGFDELEKNVKKNNFFSKLLIVILVLFIIASLVLISNYVFNLGLF